jgi:hypothetical protein
VDFKLNKILSLFQYLDGTRDLTYLDLKDSIEALDYMIQESTEVWGLFNDAKKCYYKIEFGSSKAKSEFARTLMYFLNYLDLSNESLDNENRDIIKANIDGARSQVNLSLVALFHEKLTEESGYSQDGSQVYLALSSAPSISDPFAYPKL